MTDIAPPAPRPTREPAAVEADQHVRPSDPGNLAPPAAPASDRTLDRARLAALIAARKKAGGDRAFPRLEGDGPFELSFAQSRLWFLDRLYPGSAQYNVPAGLRLHGPLDVVALAGALADVVRRHETLRTRFAAGPQGPLQWVTPVPEDLLEVVDLQGLPAGDRLAEAERRAGRLATLPFDLASGRLLRALLLVLGPEDHGLVVVQHHIASDGWSLGLFLTDVAALYEARAAGREAHLPALPVRYVEFGAWQRAELATHLDERLAFWRQTLAGAPPLLALPTDRPRPLTASGRGGEVPCRFDGSVASAARSLAQERGATLFMVLLAVWQNLLARHAGQDDVVVGSPVAGRLRPELEGLVGFFVNTVAFRGRFDGDPDLVTALARTKEVALGAFAHQDLPFERLVEDLAPDRAASHPPIFQVVLALQNAPLAPAFPGVQVSPLIPSSATAKFDLMFALREADGGLVGSLEFDRDLFDAATAERLLARFGTLLPAALARPAAALSELPWFPDSERRQVLTEWNQTAVEIPEEPIHRRFAAVVAASPTALAVRSEAVRLTYAELDRRADNVAAELVRRGVGPEVAVALALERSVENIVATLAVLKAGGFFVPLDAGYPAERLRFMLEDSGARVLLAHESLLAKLPAERPETWVVGADLGVEASGDLAESADTEVGRDTVGLTERLESSLELRRTSRVAADLRVGRLFDAEGLAYVMYTSGSTGKPKGVAVPHRAVVRLVTQPNFVTLGPGETVLQLAPTSFDAATLEIWGALLAGGTLAVPAAGSLSLGEIAAALDYFEVTTLWLTAGLFHQMAEIEGAALSRVRQVLAGGDVLAPAAVERVVAGLAPGAVLVNGYGPTENTTFTACHVMATAADVVRPVPVGRPITNTRALVLDADLRPVPVGVPGELYAAGLGLARGYLGRPGLTAERFVPNPVAQIPGERLYRTGDQVRWRPDGTLEFLGRLDGQVKLRGFRIELGEIEAVLGAHPAVATAAAVVADGRLFAFVTAAPGVAGVPTSELESKARAELPAFMVPAAFVPLAELPLNANGKVDKKALAARAAWVAQEVAARLEFVAPRSAVEAAVAAAFAGVLGLEVVSIEANFFELGGHSLLATQLVSRLREALGVELPLRAVFEAPTPAGLAARLPATAGTSSAGAPRKAVVDGPAAATSDGELAPLSFAQERLWFLDRFEPGSTAYHVPVVLDAEGPLDPERFAAAVRATAARHEILRTVYVETAAGPRQRVLADVPAPRVVDLSALPEAERAAAAAAVKTEFRAETFDLAHGPVLHAVLLTLGARRHTFLLNVHHIAADGWSAGVFVRDLVEAYRALGRGEDPHWPELPTSYRQFAQGQRQRLSGSELESQLGYWRTRLAAVPPLELPTDHPRPQLARRPLGGHERRLGRELTAALQSFAREHQATLFMILLANFEALLARLAGQQDFAVGTPIANRHRGEIENLVGLFVNTLALRSEVPGATSFRDLVARVRESTLDAYAHQELPFERLVDEVAPERSLDRTPVFQVFFTLQNTSASVPQLGDVSFVSRRQTAATIKFDWVVTASEQPDGEIELLFDHDVELFDAATAEAWGDAFEAQLVAALATPEVPLEHLALVTPAVAATLGERGRGPTPAAATDAALHEWVFMHRDLAAPALEDARGTLSYGQLERRSAALARQLVAAGVGLESRVGLALPRGIDLGLAALAVLRAGGAYVPLDLELPAERLRHLVADSGVGLVVTATDDLPPALAGLPRCDLRQDFTDAPDVALPVVPATAAAYVIYTSGSTGRPKGVVVPHRAITRHLLWFVREFGFGAETRVLQKTPASFDASVWELFAPLVAGGVVVFAEPAAERDPERLLALVAAARITTLQAVPTLWRLLLGAEARATLGALRQLFVGGEAFDAALAAGLAAVAPDAEIVNLYGPTETTVQALFARLDGPLTAATVPIGRPVAGTRASLEDPLGRPLPLGFVGELLVGGDQVARGYLGQPALTAERFVPDPASSEPGARRYRTGDLVRLRADGRFEYRGRTDAQVKLRGFRIELEEIEAVLAEHPAVAAAAVAVVPGPGGEDRLVAFVSLSAERKFGRYLETEREPQGSGRPSGRPNTEPTEALRSFLATRLPEAMVPSSFVELETLPLTASGKLDRRALVALAPRAERSAALAYREPAAGFEQTVAAAFAAVLELPRVGADDDFFALGGHSLLGVRLTSRLAAETGLTVPVRALFERRTPALLAAWLERAERPAGAGLPLRGYQPKGRPRASFAQQRLWFLDRLEGSSSAYHIPVALTIEGPLDLARLRASLVAVVDRHEALRTVFAEEAGVPIQVVGPARLPFTVVDLASVVAAAGAERAAQVAAELAGREAVAPFDLAHDPLLRATVIRFSPEHHRLVLVLHHIVSDGGSMPVFVRDFLAFYRAGGAAALAPLPVQYPAFAEWQREHLAGAYLEHLLSYWRGQLRDVPVIELPADRLRPAVPVRRVVRRSVVLCAETSRQLNALTRRTGGTLFMTLLAGFATFVSRLTGQDDFAVGSPIDNRNRREIEGLIGFLVNTLVLRMDLAGNPSFEQWVARVRETALDAYAHQEVPFERLVEEVGAVRQLATTPLFQVFFVLQNNARPNLELQGLRFLPAELGLEKAKFDLSLAATETADGIELDLELDHDLFDSATAERFARRLVALLSAAAADPSLAVSRLPVLDAAEAAEVLHGANPDRLFPVVRDLLHAPFERQAALRPDSVALIVGEAELSYGELAARSGRLAARLRALGVGPERLVGVCLERGAQLPVALLAVLRAGGAYVPLDPAYPEDRLSFMLEDAGARVVLSERALAGLTERVIAGAGLAETATALWLDDADDPTAGTSPAAASEEPAVSGQRPGLSRPEPENLAYLIYTSGSTGRPKAVAISHQNAATMLAWAEREFAPEERAVVLAATSVSFDLSVFELFLPLAVGATVVLAKNALELPTLPARDRITLVNTVPSAMAELVRSSGLPAAVRTVNLAGEPLKGDLVRRVFEHPGVSSVVNLYGPSEDTTYSTIARLERGDSREPTIGRPIAGSSVHLLDRNLEPVGIGVPGELYLGGAGISRGYLGRPGVTAERYVPDPFAAELGESGGRLYKTGDLVRRLPDGRLDYLGRLDHQVKVRGFRIELGEIEAALTSHPAVSAAAVVAKKDDAGGVLVAWVEVGAEPVLPAAELAPRLAAHLRRTLPDSMVPSFFFALPALPLTPNGKIDRRALLARGTAAATTARVYRAPRTPLETRLCVLFAEVLEVARVGVEDSFFDLGGHSLRATRLVSRLRDELHVELPLREVFQQRTPGALAPVVAALVPFEATGSKPPAHQPPSLRARPPGSPTPASYSQERLWILEQIEAGTAAYNMPFAVRLVGRWDLRVLAAALDGLAARHESLRTTFVTRDGQPFQVVSPPAPVALPVVDLRAVPPERRAAASVAVLDAAALTPFDLEAGPLLRALAVITADDELLLQLNLHHSICDGWSVSILVREFTTFYSARSLGRSPALAPLPIQYGDYAAWQREWLSGPEREHQLAYWRRQLTGAPPGLDLPFDRPRPAVRSYRGGQVSVAFPRVLSDRLRSLAAHEGGSLFMVLLAAWKLLLARLSGEHDVVVGSPIAGRGRAEVEGLIGMFLNTLVLRTDVSGNPSFRELVARVRETALGAFAHQDVPFEMLLSELRPERDLSRTPFFQIFFNLLNLPESRPLDLPAVRLEAVAMPEMPSKFDLTLYVQPTEEIRIEAVYNADLFDPSTIERFLDQYRSLLGQVAAAPEQPVDRYHLRLPGDARVLPDPEAPLSEAWYGAIHEALERGAAAHPDRLAVIGVAEQISYRQLDAHANAIAHRLIAGGVVPGDRVVVWAARSVQLPAAVFGVLKTGAAYAMLDPSYPAARLVEMVEMLTPRAIVILEAGGELPAELDAALVGRARVHVGATLAERGTHVAPGIPVGPDDVAVIGFTSGSTGKPKGIEGRHGPLTHFAPWMAERFGLGPDDRFTLLSGLAHDPLQRDLFTPIQLGATLCVPDPRAIGTPGLMAAWLLAEGITVMHLTPAMAQVLTERPATGEAPQVPSLRRAFLVGDVLTRKDVARLRQLAPGITVVNLYGSTETQRAVSHHQIAPGVEETTREVLPLGRGMADVQLLVLGPDGELAGLGEVGELAMRSPHLAKGYLDDPATTAAKFVGTGQRRLYRTGDLGRYLPNGDAVFVGRADQQVKIRGFRIELGEITGQLSRLPGVREAALILRKDGPLGERLVAFVVPDPGQPAPAVADLRDGLKERLPAYMVPAAFVLLGQLPMTPNGKLDRRALAKIEPEVGSGAPSAAAEAPRSWLEDNLARAFAAVLGRERVGVEDEFEALGVHPSLAAELIAQVRGAVGVTPTEAELFAAGSVAKLAETLEAARQAGRVDRTPPPLLPRTVTGPLPLSPLQERLWLAERFEPGSPAHRLHLAVYLRGPVDTAALARAVRVLAGRHELLRTTFVSDGHHTSQQVAPEPSLALQRQTPAAVVSFDLARGPLVAFQLVDEAPATHRLEIVAHQLVADAWTLRLWLAELGRIYGAEATGTPLDLPPPALQYGDYALWLRDWLAGGERAIELSYWWQRLADAPQGLDLPLDRSRPAIRAFHPGQRELALPGALVESLQALAANSGVDLAGVLLAAWKLLLARLTGEHDVVVGWPTAGRHRREVAALAGAFGNPLVLRTDLAGDPSFRTLLARVEETRAGALAHPEVPFELLLEELKIERDLSRTPLFQVAFSVAETPTATPAEWPGVSLEWPGVSLEWPGVSLEWLATPEPAAKYDLTLQVRPEGGELRLAAGYNADLFDDTTLARLLDQYVGVLAQAVAEPEAPLSAFALERAADRALLPDPAAPLDATWHGPVHDALHRWAAAAPDRLALVGPEESFSYGEYERRVNRLAQRLLQLGIERGDRVAIFAQRTARLPLAVLATLEAGGVFVMLDPSYPASRLIDMLEIAEPKVLIHLAGGGLEVPQELESYLFTLPAYAGKLVLPNFEAERAGTLGDPGAGLPETATGVAVGPDDLAYIAFTSGSTGKPKGVMGRHGPLSHFLPWLVDRFGLSGADRFTLLSGLAHDPLQRDLCTPLWLGAALVAPDPRDLGTPGRLASWLQREALTVTHLTPAMAQILTERPASGEPIVAPSLRRAFLVGDVLTRRDVARLRHLAPGITVVNLYGSTETQRAVGCHEILPESAADASGDRGREVLPLGRGMKDVQLLVLNPRGAVAGIGEVGELVVRSPHLAAGYLGDAALSAAKFVVNPATGEETDRLYRTGDLGRYLPNGEAVFVGRADQQVKIRGFRIELGEIIGHLSKAPGVREAVVLLRRDGPLGERLAAYVVPEPSSAIRPTAGSLREFLKARVPGYMVPATFVFLTGRMPVTPNNKLDRRALLALDDRGLDSGGSREAPTTEAEAKVAVIIEDVLKLPSVGLDDNFFDLGGNSLLLVQVHGRLEQVFSRPVVMVELFNHPTVRSLAAHLTETTPDDSAPVVETKAEPQRSEQLQEGRDRLKRRLDRRRGG